MFWCVREEYPCNFSAEIYIIFSTRYYLLISVDDLHALYQGRKRKNKLLKWIFFLPKKPILHMDDPVHTFVSFSLKVQQQNTWVNGLMDFDLSSLIWSRSVHHQSVIWLDLPLNVFSRWKMTFGFNNWMYILEKKFVGKKMSYYYSKVFYNTHYAKKHNFY